MKKNHNLAFLIVCLLLVAIGLTPSNALALDVPNYDMSQKDGKGIYFFGDIALVGGAYYFIEITDEESDRLGNGTLRVTDKENADFYISKDNTTITLLNMMEFFNGYIPGYPPVFASNEDHLIIEVVGNCELVSEVGAIVQGNNITITGDGSLELTSTNNNAILANGNVIIQTDTRLLGANGIINTGSAQSAVVLAGGDLSVSTHTGNGIGIKSNVVVEEDKLNVTVRDVAYTGSNYNAGLGIDGNLTVNGGQVEVRGGSTNALGRNGGSAVANLTVNGGEVLLFGGEAQDSQSGHGGHGVLHTAYINGGLVRIVAGDGAFTALGKGGNGINGAAYISGGTLLVSGGNVQHPEAVAGYGIAAEAGIAGIISGGKTYVMGGTSPARQQAFALAPQIETGPDIEAEIRYSDTATHVGDITLNTGVSDLATYQFNNNHVFINMVSGTQVKIANTILETGQYYRFNLKGQATVTSADNYNVYYQVENGFPKLYLNNLNLNDNFSQDILQVTDGDLDIILSGSNSLIDTDLSHTPIESKNAITISGAGNLNIAGDYGINAPAISLSSQIKGQSIGVIFNSNPLFLPPQGTLAQIEVSFDGVSRIIPVASYSYLHNYNNINLSFPSQITRAVRYFEQELLADTYYLLEDVPDSRSILKTEGANADNYNLHLSADKKVLTLHNAEIKLKEHIGGIYPAFSTYSDLTVNISGLNTITTIGALSESIFESPSYLTFTSSGSEDDILYINDESSIGEALITSYKSLIIDNLNLKTKSLLSRYHIYSQSSIIIKNSTIEADPGETYAGHRYTSSNLQHHVINAFEAKGMIYIYDSNITAKGSDFDDTAVIDNMVGTTPDNVGGKAMKGHGLYVENSILNVNGGIHINPITSGMGSSQVPALEFTQPIELAIGADIRSSAGITLTQPLFPGHTAAQYFQASGSELSSFTGQNTAQIIVSEAPPLLTRGLINIMPGFKGMDYRSVDGQGLYNLYGDSLMMEDQLVMLNNQYLAISTDNNYPALSELGIAEQATISGDYRYLSEAEAAALIGSNTDLYEGATTRPVFNINPHNVVFRNYDQEGKVGTIANPEATHTDLGGSISGRIWYPTLLDSKRANFAVSDFVIIDDLAEFKYSGAIAGANEYISIMLLGAEDEILYYSKVQNITASEGLITFTLPQIWDAQHQDILNMYVFNEQINPNDTDYSSPFIRQSVLVQYPWQVLQFAESDVSLVYGEEGFINPLSGDQTIPVYSSSNTDIAQVNEDGEILIVSVGTTVITATAPEGNQTIGGSRSYNLTITPKELTAEIGDLSTTKAYDGTVAVTDFSGELVLDGVLANDSVWLDMTIGDYSLADVHSGQVPVQFALSGAEQDLANYTLTNSELMMPATITPKALSIAAVSAVDREYVLGNLAVEIDTITFNEAAPLPAIGAGVIATGSLDDENVGNNKTVAVVVNDIGLNYSLAANTTSTTVNISKTDYSGNTDFSAGAGFGERVSVPLLPWSGLLDAELSWQQTQVNGSNELGITDISGRGADTMLNFGFIDDISRPQPMTVMIKVSSHNYHDFMLNGLLTPLDKERPVLEVADMVVDYSGSPVSSDLIVGTATFDGEEVEGTWRFVETDAVLTQANNGRLVTVLFDPDDDRFTTPSITTLLTINKINPSGQPAYSEILSSGQMLSDLNLSIGTISPEGTIIWDDGANTAIISNQTYGWTFYPHDSQNYNRLKGSLIPWQGSDISEQDLQYGYIHYNSEITSGSLLTLDHHMMGLILENGHNDIWQVKSINGSTDTADYPLINTLVSYQIDAENKISINTIDNLIANYHIESVRNNPYTLYQSAAKPQSAAFDIDGAGTNPEATININDDTVFFVINEDMTVSVYQGIEQVPLIVKTNQYSNMYKYYYPMGSIFQIATIDQGATVGAVFINDNITRERSSIEDNEGSGYPEPMDEYDGGSEPLNTAEYRRIFGVDGSNNLSTPDEVDLLDHKGKYNQLSSGQWVLKTDGTPYAGQDYSAKNEQWQEYMATRD